MTQQNSDYIYRVFGSLIVIIDLNHGNLSVTNDIENVISYLGKQTFKLQNYVIVYRDSNSEYDQVVVKPDNTFQEFEPLTTDSKVKDLFDVIEILTENQELIT